MTTFLNGAKEEYFGVVFILAVARGLSITLTESGINDLLVDELASGFSKMHQTSVVLILFILFTVLSIFIPSTSSLSSAVFPTIGTSLHSMTALLVTSSVTTFSWASGFVNLITPTGITIPALETVKIDYSNFLKGTWKIFLIIFLSALLLLLVGSLLPVSKNLF